MNKIEIRANSEKEAFELIEKGGIVDDGQKEDAIIAEAYIQQHAELIRDLLNNHFNNI